MKVEHEDSTEPKGMCKRCGCNLYSSDGVKAGYCTDCANHYKDAKKAWEDKGLAKFCSCGQMLHSQDSIEAGRCITCRRIFAREMLIH